VQSIVTILMRIALLVATLALVSCKSVGTAAQDPDADSALFSILVNQLLERYAGEEVRVDPRPLKPDPKLVTLRETPDEIQDRMPTVTEPWLAGANELATRRASLLSTLDVSTTNASDDAQCHIILQGMEFEAVDCPAERYVSVVFSTARDGSEYWPTNVGDASALKVSGRATVRSIETMLGPDGFTSSAYDWVFDISGSEPIFIDSVLLITFN